MPTLRSACLLFLLLFLPLSAPAQKAPPAPKGFAWKKFPALHLSVQVPQGWHSRMTQANGNRVLQITKDPVTAAGFETGLTINLLERKTDAEMAAAIGSIGEYVKHLQGTFTKLIESRVTENQGVQVMILEGIRSLPNEPARGLYHTRTTVYVLKKQRRIYTVIFGSPAGRWTSDFKFGEVMLNPLDIQVD